MRSATGRFEVKSNRRWTYTRRIMRILGIRLISPGSYRYLSILTRFRFSHLDAMRKRLVGLPQPSTTISFITLALLGLVLPLFSPGHASTRDQNAVFAPSEPTSSPEPTSGPQPQRARSAYDFVNSIGVNTHLNYFDRTYNNFLFVKQELKSVGIRHLRDGIHLQDPGYNRMLYGRWSELGKLGIRFDAVLDPRSNLGPDINDVLQKAEALSDHTIESIEGANELDISGMPNWVSVDRAFQKTIFAAAKSMHDPSRIQVVGPSLAFASHGTKLGNLADFLDEGNLHPYPAAKIPSIVFPEQVDLARAVSGDRPIVITETGYHNALNDHTDQPAVSELAAAKYIPRLFLEDFARGIPRTFLYEFLDEAPDPELRNNQLHWGLIRADGTEKPAFLALKRLIAELADHGEPTTLGALAWSISSSNAEIHHLLLQKSSGEFDLVLWQEVASYDFRRQEDLTNPPAALTLTLGQRMRRIAVYEPNLKDDPIETSENQAAVHLEVPDQPIVVSISPR